SADHHLVLAGATGEDRLKPRQEGDEERRSRGEAERAQPVRELGREPQSAGEAGVRLKGGTRAVRGQLQHGEVPRELPAPEAPEALPSLLREEPVLPADVVGVAERQGREPRRAPAGLLAVESGELADEEPERPEIRHQMVHGEEQQPAAVLETPDSDSQQRPSLVELERAIGLGYERDLRSRRRWFLDPEVHGEALVNDLTRLAAMKGESGPQSRVAIGQSLERTSQGLRVEPAFDADRRRHVVGGDVRRQPAGKPPALLSGRERMLTERRP